MKRCCTIFFPLKRSLFRSRAHEVFHADDLPTSSFLIAALQACSTLRDIQTGKQIHAHATLNIYVATTLVDMYIKCGSVEKAQHVFFRMPAYTLVSWNSIILGAAENGQPLVALELFSAMRAGINGAQPNPGTYVGALKACAELAVREQGQLLGGKLVKVAWLDRGMEIHSQAAGTGCEDELYVACTLVSMYCKCGSLLDARTVFDRASSRSSVLWNALILGYVENKEPELGLKLFSCMLGEFEGDVLGFVAGLKACSSFAEKEEGAEVDGKLVKVHSLEKGMAIHSQAVELGLEAEVMLSNTLIDMYSTCGCTQGSRKTFDRMSSYNVVSWNALLTGYTLNGELELAFQLFLCMNVPPDARTLVAVVKACSISRDLDRGRSLHRLAVEGGLDSDIFLSSSLVDMYVKCGSLVEARRVFDTSVAGCNVVAWNALLLGYAESRNGACAMELFYTGRSAHGCVPDALTLVAMFKACASLAAEEQGTELDGKVIRLAALEKTMDMHTEALRWGDVFSAIEVQNTLLTTYARCGSVEDARRVFDTMKLHDTVSWNALLLAHGENGEAERTLELFVAMQHEPDVRTFTAAVKACTSLAGKETGRERHGKVVKELSLEKGLGIEKSLSPELQRDVFLATSLVDMYSRCGSTDNARRVFMSVAASRNPDAVLWNSLIAGYAENGDGELALEVFRSMQLRECSPDARSYSAALKACSSIGALEAGKEIHATVCRLGVVKDAVLELALVDLYSKCGSLVNAQQVFDAGGKCWLSSYNALMTGYSCRGNVEQVYVLFGRMVEEGFRPDGVSFCSVLAACSHAGRVEEGKRWFEVMESEYGVRPGIEHYHCLIDMLGRANLVDEVCSVVNKMSHERDEVTWTTVLATCSKWKESNVGKMAFESLVRMNNQQGAAYVLMSKVIS